MLSNAKTRYLRWITCFSRWTTQFCVRLIQSKNVLSNANMYYPTQLSVIQCEDMLSNANYLIQHENVLFNANTCYPKWKTCYQCDKWSIQCDNVLFNARTFFPMQKSCYPTWKGIICRDFFAFFVLYVPFVLARLGYFRLRGTKRNVRPPVINS